MRPLVLMALLVGCAPIPPSPDAGTSFGIEHGRGSWGGAVEGAAQHCARHGLRAQHVRTDRIGLFTIHGSDISWFECVEAGEEPPASALFLSPGTFFL